MPSSPSPLINVQIRGKTTEPTLKEFRNAIENHDLGALNHILSCCDGRMAKYRPHVLGLCEQYLDENPTPTVSHCHRLIPIYTTLSKIDADHGHRISELCSKLFKNGDGSGDGIVMRFLWCLGFRFRGDKDSAVNDSQSFFLRVLRRCQSIIGPLMCEKPESMQQLLALQVIYCLHKLCLKFANSSPFVGAPSCHIPEYPS